MDVRQDQLIRREGTWHWSYEELRTPASPPVEAWLAKAALIEAIENRPFSIEEEVC